jgi:hypothetical protein
MRRSWPQRCERLEGALCAHNFSTYRIRQNDRFLQELTKHSVLFLQNTVLIFDRRFQNRQTNSYISCYRMLQNYRVSRDKPRRKRLPASSAILAL